MNSLAETQSQPATVLRDLVKPGGATSIRWLSFWVLVASVAFCAAYASKPASSLVLIYLFALLQLAQADTWRKASYAGLAVGLIISVSRLEFFWRIFSAGAVALWYVYAIWIGLFVAIARLCLRQFGSKWGWLPILFIWPGLEYFRSELYYLRFSWLNPGYAGVTWQVPLKQVGVYGLGFLLMIIATAVAVLWQKSKPWALALLLTVGVGLFLTRFAAPETVPKPASAAVLHLAGIQLEMPAEREVLLKLDEAIRKEPGTELVVLSEYTFSEPIPEKVKAWCRKNRRYLIVGGTEPASGAQFYNTAFVIGPSGEIIFRQVKAVPI